MKISSSQMFRQINKWCFGALAALLITTASPVNAQDGGAIFAAKCATCHQPHKNSTGPKLFEVRKKWEEGGAKDGSIYQWVNNWSVAAANDPYAQQVSAWSPTAMTFFPELSHDDIDAIFNWVDEQPVPGGEIEEGGPAVATDDEEGGSWIWIILGVIFIIIILAVGGVRRQLKTANGEIRDDRLSYAEEFRAWAWKYRLYVGLGSLVIVIAVIVTLFLGLYQIGVVEDYQPSQPIEFPHAIHAGKNGIDCKYCHNSVTKSKTAGIPSVNVCMNCHKQINGTTPEQQQKIALVYEAAGWNPEGAGTYTGKTKEIVWNKVHVLPDHVYFNHQQHVVVGGIDCKQCHGDMTQMTETAKVQPVSELNKIEGNIALTKPTLTMGWCIECHGEKEISQGNIDTKEGGYYAEIHKRLLNNDKSLYREYLKDGKVTVKELGGWECAKCHY